MKAAALILLFVCFAFAQNSGPLKTCPLLPGQKAPKAKVVSIEGKSVSFKKILNNKPTAAVFYRGGWCPYCNRQLSGLRKIADEIKKEGFQLVAISPDRPEELKKTLEKQKLDYQLYSDSDLDLAKAFGLSFKVDKKTYKKYLEYGIDLEKASGKKHRSLPIPAVYVINAEGEIVYQFVNVDYKVRLDEEVLLMAIKKL